MSLEIEFDDDLTAEVVESATDRRGEDPSRQQKGRVQSSSFDFKIEQYQNV